MTTQEFLDRIGGHPERPLRWRTAAGPVQSGYHVTEIEATRPHAMVCGGAATQWDETVLQTVPPADADGCCAPAPAPAAGGCC